MQRLSQLIGLRSSASGDDQHAQSDEADASEHRAGARGLGSRFASLKHGWKGRRARANTSPPKPPPPAHWNRTSDVGGRRRQEEQQKRQQPPPQPPQQPPTPRRSLIPILRPRRPSDANPAAAAAAAAAQFQGASLTGAVLALRFEGADKVARQRDMRLWSRWGLATEHKEMEPIQAWTTRAVERDAALKRFCRHGTLESAERRSVWLSLSGVNVCSAAFRSNAATLRHLLRDKIASCPGCAALHPDHLHSFGARFLRDGGSLWTENLFDKHALSAEGARTARRLLLALQAKWAVDYCPQLPDLVCLLLLYCTEEEAFAVADSVLQRSREGSRWDDQESGGSNLQLPVGKADAHVFARTFMDLFRERLPVLHRAVVEFARDAEELEAVFLTWFERFFVGSFPLRFVLRIMDCLMVEGPKVLYRVGLALLRNSRAHILAVCAKRKRGEISLADLFDQCLRQLGSLPDLSEAQLRAAKALLHGPKRRKSLRATSTRSAGSKGSDALLALFQEEPAPGNTAASATAGAPAATVSAGAQAALAVPPRSHTPPAFAAAASAYEAWMAGVAGVSSAHSSGSSSGGGTGEEDTEAFLDDEEMNDRAFADALLGRARSGTRPRGNSLSGLQDPAAAPGRAPMPPPSKQLRPRSGSDLGTANAAVLAQAGRSLCGAQGAAGLDEDDQLDVDEGEVPRFLKWSAEQDAGAGGSDVYSGKHMAANELTLGARGFASVAPRGVADDDAAAGSGKGNVIVVQRKYGSRAFYSESSIVDSSTAAGAAMMNKIIGAGPVVHHLSSSSDGSFEFKVFLASAFGWRNLKRRGLARRDEQNRRAVSAEQELAVSRPAVGPHFPAPLLERTALLSTVDAATRLVRWLPPAARAMVMAGARVLYSSNAHGRSLQSLYEACDVPGLVGSLLLVECIPLSAVQAAQGAQNMVTVVGAFSTRPLGCGEGWNGREDHARAMYGVSASGDDDCFLFRLTPAFGAAVWKPPRDSLRGMALAEQGSAPAPSGAQHTARTRLRNIVGGGAGGAGEAMSSASTISEASSLAPSSVAGSSVLLQRSSQVAGSVGAVSLCGSMGSSACVMDFFTSAAMAEAQAATEEMRDLDRREALQEEASRGSFVACERDALSFGSVSSVYVTGDGKRIAPDDILGMTDDEVRAMRIKKMLAGPGLALDGALDQARTGWCATYENKPLCLASDALPHLSTGLQRVFSIGAVEVLGIFSKRGAASR